jgi:beta-glucanase (GH16 family)
MLSKLLALAALTVVSVNAEAAPTYSGYNIIWQENFNGAGGTPANGNNWDIIQRSNNANNEWQTYTTSTQNHQLSGGSTLQIVPLNTNGAWTSARLEGKYVFTPSDGRKTLVEAKIRFGSNSAQNKQGIWPAFWILGDSARHGAPWPGCGEIDILEMVNGQLTGYGTVHCDVAPGGICNEYNGIGGTTGMGDNGWHTWRIVIDRTPASWTSETITWYKDGAQFMQVSGGRIGNQNVWNSLATTPLYIILNVAVGGDFVSLAKLPEIEIAAVERPDC